MVLFKEISVKSIALISWMFLLSSCADDRETFTVEKSDIVEAVYSSLVIEPEEMYNVNASITGYIDEIYVKTGNDVEINDVLFRIRDVQSAKNAENARLSYELAQKNYDGEVTLLEDLKLEKENARLRRKNDSTNYSRNKQLYEKGLITKTEYEQSELAFESSKNNVETIQNRIQRTQRELKTAVLQARNTFQSNLSRSNESVMLNKVQGKVYDIFKEEGEYISMQEPIAVVGSRDAFIIVMRIDEVDITKVRLGQRIIVELEAYEDTTFEAKVTRISPKMDALTQTFEIEGEFDKLPEKLYLGLTGEGNIIVREIKSALVIPREYLIGNDIVETERGEVKVTTGAKSLSHVEIKSGLKSGDVIYKPL